MGNFILIAMLCSGHTNATCWLEQGLHYESREACLEAIRTETTTRSGVFGGQSEHRKYNPSRAFCIASDVIAFSSH